MKTTGITLKYISLNKQLAEVGNQAIALSNLADMVERLKAEREQANPGRTNWINADIRSLRDAIAFIRAQYPFKAAKISAFNTKRQYTAKGQRIAWCLLSTGNVAMVDIDRGIDYVLWTKGQENLTNSDVMDAYDNNRSTRVWDEMEYQESRDLQAALTAAEAAL